MQLTVLKGKLHRVKVTHADLEYEGSCTIDGEWLDAIGVRENEQIHIYNVTNGNRFVTYAIRGAEGHKDIRVNGSAAHLAHPGDLVIICAYATIDETATLAPKILKFKW
jgi:aspartate 1-decarboxylase